MAESYSILLRGARFTVAVSGEAQAFLEESATKQDRAKAVQVLRRLAETGTVRDETKFRSEGDGIFAVKGGQLRLYGWFSTRLKAYFVCGTGDIKKSRKADPEVLARARRLRKEFEESNANPQ